MRPVLIDFGFASTITTDGIFREFPGSPDYACPDILMGRPYNGVSADVYALGVMLYTMLYYRYPFHSENRSVMVRRVCDEEARFDPSVRVSAAGIDLLSWMLKKKGSERPSIRQILEHPFFAGCC
jgi:serine/threonine protein kinase